MATILEVDKIACYVRELTFSSGFGFRIRGRVAKAAGHFRYPIKHASNRLLSGIQHCVDIQHPYVCKMASLW